MKQLGNENDFETTWEIAALLLTDAESKYRSERLRPGGAQPLTSEAKTQIVFVVLQVCQLYQRATEVQRQEIWRLFQQAYSLWPYAVKAGHQAADQFVQTREVHWLELALTAWAISRDDYRYIYLRLGWIYLEAIRLGCAPMPSFRKIGSISFDQPRTQLTEFEESAFYRADVAPLIADARRGAYHYWGHNYGSQESDG